MRPAWSAGTAGAPPIPVLWQSKQSARPSSVCGIRGGPDTVVAVGFGDGAGVAVGVVAVGGGVGIGVGAGVVVGAGAGFGAGAGVVAGAAPPPQETANSVKPSIASETKYSPRFLFITYLLIF